MFTGPNFYIKNIRFITWVTFFIIVSVNLSRAEEIKENVLKDKKIKIHKIPFLTEEEIKEFNNILQEIENSCNLNFSHLCIDVMIAKKKMKQFLDQMTNINKKDLIGQSLLYLAAKSGNSQVVKFLLDQGANINIIVDNAHFDSYEQGYTPLRIAIENHNLQIIKELIHRGAKLPSDPTVNPIAFEMKQMFIRNKEWNKESDLYQFIAKGDIASAMKWLDDHRAGMIKHHIGGMALHIAVRKGYTQIVKKLLDQGVNVNAKDADGQTALHKVFLGKQKADHQMDRKSCLSKSEILILKQNVQKTFTEIIKLLVNKGIDIHARDENRQTALHKAFSTQLTDTLLDNGANIEAKDNNGYTPLHTVPDHLIKHLIVRGANVNARDNNGSTVLYKEISYYSTNKTLITFLINRGSDLNISDNNGYTILHKLALMGSGLDMIKLLIDKGADI